MLPVLLVMPSTVRFSLRVLAFLAPRYRFEFGNRFVNAVKLVYNGMSRVRSMYALNSYEPFTNHKFMHMCTLHKC